MKAVLLFLAGSALALQAPELPEPIPSRDSASDQTAANETRADLGELEPETEPLRESLRFAPPPAATVVLRLPEIDESTARYTSGGALWQIAFAPATWPIWALTVAILGAMLASLWMVLLLRRQIGSVSRPRLYLEDVRFTGLDAGSRPIFFARIGNAGGTDAHDVTVTISAVYPGGGGKAGAPQTMTIPPHGKREFFVRWQSALTTAVREDIIGGSRKLSMTIAVQHSDSQPQKYCYQFCPWEGDRPRGVPDFVPCDLDAQLGETERA